MNNRLAFTQSLLIVLRQRLEILWVVGIFRKRDCRSLTVDSWGRRLGVLKNALPTDIHDLAQVRVLAHSPAEVCALLHSV